MSTTREVAERIVATLLYGPVTDYNSERNAAVTDAIDKALQDERERAARIAENPYSDEVEAFAGDEPKAVGTKIAVAIREGNLQEN